CAQQCNGESKNNKKSLLLSVMNERIVTRRFGSTLEKAYNNGMRTITRWSIFIGAWLLAFLFSTPTVWANEQISQFASDIAIQSDGSLQIQETINYTTDTAKHGLYRYIPVRYQRNNWSYTTPI